MSTGKILINIGENPNKGLTTFQWIETLSLHITILYYLTLLSINVMVFVIGFHFKQPFLTLSVIAYLLSCILIKWGELYFPYKENWNPSIQDIINFSKFFSISLIFRLLNPTIDVQASIQFNVLNVLELLITLEFLHYSLHRISHSNSFLWKCHTPHHATRKLNMLVTWTDNWIAKMLPYLLCYALYIRLKPSGVNFLMAYHILMLHNILIHSNIDTHFGFAQKLIVTPEFHRIHHFPDKAFHQKNISVCLTIWDHLFKTFEDPKKYRFQNHETEVGLKNTPDDFLWSQIKVLFKA